MRKNDNKHRIFCHLIKNGVTSRKNLAEIIGISTAAITKITNVMIQEGIIQEVGILASDNVGRKSIGLKIVSDCKFLAGFDITSTSIRISITTLDLTIVDYKRIIHTKLTKTVILDAIKVLDTFIKKIDQDKIVGIGLVVQGYVNNYVDHNLEIVNCYEILKEHYDFDIMMLNNIKALAIYEQLFSKIEKNFFMVKYGPGVGGVFVIDQKIYEGNNFLAGEFGHINWGISDGNYCEICKKYNCLESDIHISQVFKNMNVKVDPDLSIEKLIYESQKEGSVHLKLALIKLARCVNIITQVMDINQIILVGALFENEYYFKMMQSIFKSDLDCNVDLTISYLENFDSKRRLIATSIILNNYLYNVK